MAAVIEAFPAIVGQGSIVKVQSEVCTTPTPSGGTPFLPKVRGGFHISMKEEEEEMERKRKMRKRKKKMFKFRHKVPLKLNINFVKHDSSLGSRKEIGLSEG